MVGTSPVDAGKRGSGRGHSSPVSCAAGAKRSGAAGSRAESDATLQRAVASFDEMGIAPEAEAVRATLASETQDASA